MLATINTPLITKPNLWNGWANFAFFFVGIAGDVVLCSVVMSVASYRRILGDAVLARLGGVHFASSTCAMLLVPVVSYWFPSVKVQQATLAIAFACMLCVLAFLWVQAWLQFSITATTLLFLIGVNGVCAGSTQCTGAALAGTVRKFAQIEGVSAAQNIGAAFGQAITTILQLTVLASTYAGVELGGDSVRVGMLVIYSFALTAMSFAIVAIVIISHLSCWEKQTEDMPTRVFKKETDPACRFSAAITSVEKWNVANGNMIILRVQQLWPVAVGEFLVSIVLVFMLQLSPVLELSSSSPFWDSYFVTIIVACNNVFDFVGRSIYKVVPKRFVFKGAWILALTRIVLAGFLIVLISMGPQSLWVYLSLFIVVPIMGGMAVVLFAEHGQSYCGHSNWAPCTATAQVCWISVMIGCLCGTVMSTFYLHCFAATK